MLGDADLTTMVAVKDAAEAAKFYEHSLGLTKLDSSPTVIRYQSGPGTLVVYESPTAGTNQATTAVWTVDDLEGTVAALKERGVPFVYYDDVPGVTRDGDIHDNGVFETAWFTDPTGNIFEVNEGVDLNEIGV
jgi:catechol 2,3-dioxygenase-like lactoylglutathione lyase family enzyme